MENELNRLCRLTRRPKSFFLKEALGQYLERTRRRAALRTPIKKKPSGKARAKQRRKVEGPLDDLVGKYSLGKGIVTNAALEHNDIYDYALPWDRPENDDEFPMIP